MRINRLAPMPVGKQAPISHPRRLLPGQELVYCVISQRARGLSVGINLNPDKRCNFACCYCEVDRSIPGGLAQIPIARMIGELRALLELVHEREWSQLGYAAMPEELLELREIALSGDGEPTLCPNFREVIAAVVHLRGLHVFPYFKLVLITNCAALQEANVQAGIDMLAPQDEIWAKLDVGTQAYMDVVNRPEVPLKVVLKNIRDLGCKRPIVIQSLFVSIAGMEPPDAEIEAYARRLFELKTAGAQISLVQVYSAHRRPIDACCAHLPLRVLSKIARRVREITGLPAEVF